MRAGTKYQGLVGWWWLDCWFPLLPFYQNQGCSRICTQLGGARVSPENIGRTDRWAGGQAGRQLALLSRSFPLPSFLWAVSGRADRQLPQYFSALRRRGRGWRPQSCPPSLAWCTLLARCYTQGPGHFFSQALGLVSIILLFCNMLSVIIFIFYTNFYW